MIEFQHVAKSFHDKVVLKEFNMTIRDGELTVLIGPSGCGKTTTLKMINRLINPTSGTIRIDGKDIQDMDKVALRREMGYVIQQGGLFPHLTVRQNIELIESLDKKPKAQILKKTVDLMNMIDMDPEQYLDRYPCELSGGQLQRIGVARAFSNDPDIILFDEPFSALDPITRASLQDQLLEIQAHQAKTMVFVTHDMDEAIKIADRICIMHDGVIVQYDTPEQILRNPANDYVENFIGANRIWSSPEYMKVEDFMLKNPVCCSPSYTMDQCAVKLRATHVDSLMVVDKDGVFCGIIDKRTFFNNPSATASAQSAMRQAEITAGPEDCILDVIEKLRGSSYGNVPVVDRFGRLKGLLTNSRLMFLLSRQYLEDETVKPKEGELQ